MPKRIQRQRNKGWKMPPNTIYVGRPSDYGNTHVVFVDVSTHQQAVDLFERDMKEWREAVGEKKWETFISRLRGKDLACWCPLDKPCHADVLLRLANEKDE